VLKDGVQLQVLQEQVVQTVLQVIQVLMVLQE